MRKLPVTCSTEGKISPQNFVFSRFPSLQPNKCIYKLWLYFWEKGNGKKKICYGPESFNFYSDVNMLWLPASYFRFFFSSSLPFCFFHWKLKPSLGLLQGFLVRITHTDSCIINGVTCWELSIWMQQQCEVCCWLLMLVEHEFGHGLWELHRDTFVYQVTEASPHTIYKGRLIYPPETYLLQTWFGARS